MNEIRSEVIIALGANLPLGNESPSQTLTSALQHLERNVGEIRAISQFYQTPCFPAGAGPDYVNAVAVLSSTYETCDILTHLHKIEAQFARERLQRWGMRTLDLDLVAMEGHISPSEGEVRRWIDLSPDLQRQVAPTELILPHPRVQDRAFVLVPLCDVRPDWMHPVLKKTASEMLVALPKDEIHAVRPI